VVFGQLFACLYGSNLYFLAFLRGTKIASTSPLFLERDVRRGSYAPNSSFYHLLRQSDSGSGRRRLKCGTHALIWNNPFSAGLCCMFDIKTQQITGRQFINV